MSTSVETYRATDNDFLEAAGIDPEKYPANETLYNYLIKTFGPYFEEIDDYYWEQIKKDGWFNVNKHFTLKERFAQAGLEIVKDEMVDMVNGFYGWEDCRVIELSNGMVLREVEDKEKSDAMYSEDDRDVGNVFYIVYSAKRVK